MSHWGTTSPSGSRRGSRRRRALLVSVLAVALVGLVGASSPAGAQEAPPPGLTLGEQLTGTTIQGAKSTSGRLAETDPALLGLDSSDPVPVVVKLDYDALASYTGDIAGLPATSPQVTGEDLDLTTPDAERYEGYIEGVETEFLDALAAEVPSAVAGDPLRVVYGGLPVEVPGDQIDTLLTLPGVAAVQPDVPEQPTTDSSPAFIGAPTLYDQLGATAADAGEGTVVGILDTGVWPEHPRFADPGTLPAPPPKSDGTARVCDLGDNPLTPAADVFACQNKLIGGQPFIDTYNAVIGGEVYPDSARDSNGHGTHTASTSAGGPATRVDLRHPPRRHPRHRPRRRRHGLQGLRPPGVLPVRLRRRGRPGHRRRRRRHQLLHLRRQLPVRRRRRARVPRRLRRRRVRRRVRRQLRPRPGHHRPPQPLGRHRRRLPPVAGVRVDRHPQRHRRRHCHRHRRDHHPGHRQPAARRVGRRAALLQPAVPRPGATRAVHRQDRRLRAGPRAGSPRASPCSRAAPPACCSSTPPRPTS